MDSSGARSEERRCTGAGARGGEGGFAQAMRLRQDVGSGGR